MNPEANLFSTAIEMIANVGFPIFISLYLLHKFEAKLDAVVQAVTELTKTMEKQYK